MNDQVAGQWRDQLPEDMRGDASLGQINTITDLANNYLNGQKHIGGSIRIPTQEASTEDWDTFHAKLQDKVPGLMNVPTDEAEALTALQKRLGRPDTAEGYKVEGMSAEELEFAFSLGLSGDQVAQWQEKRTHDGTAATEAADEQLRVDTDALKKLWGHAYDTNLAQAKNAVLAYADEEGQKFLSESGLDSDPAFIQLMSKVGAGLNEEQIIGVTVKNDLNLTPADAQAKIADIRNNPQHPYNDRTHREHSKAAADMTKLYIQAHPEAA